MSSNSNETQPSVRKAALAPESHDDYSRRRLELREKLRHAVNYTSMENASNTPDFILAEYLVACLDAFTGASNAREKWYGKSLSIGGDNAVLAQPPAPASAADYTTMTAKELVKFVFEKTECDTREGDPENLGLLSVCARTISELLAPAPASGDEMSQLNDDEMSYQLDVLERRRTGFAQPAPAQRIQPGDYAILERAANGKPAPASADVEALCAEADMMGSWTLSDTNLYPDKVLMMVQDLATTLRATDAARVQAERERDAALGLYKAETYDTDFKERLLDVSNHTTEYWKNKAECLRAERDAALARAEVAERALVEARDMIQTRDDELESVYAERDALRAQLATAQAELAALGPIQNLNMPYGVIAVRRVLTTPEVAHG